MDSESWLEKVDRLRVLLDRLQTAPVLEAGEAAARDSIAIALWLRKEFTGDVAMEGSD